MDTTDWILLGLALACVVLAALVLAGSKAWAWWQGYEAQEPDDDL